MSANEKELFIILRDLAGKLYIAPQGAPNLDISIVVYGPCKEEACLAYIERSLNSVQLSTTLPHTRDEMVLATIFAEILSLEQVNLDGNFFDLGGNSLHVVRLISRIRSAFGVQVPLKALFESPTVQGLSARLYEKSRS